MKRAALFVAVAGSISAVVALLFVARTVGLFGSAVTCFTVDAQGNYVRGDCPPMVIPPRESDSATIMVEVPNADPGWIEGGYFFIRATAPDEQVVMEQQLDYQWSESDGPAASGEVRPPPTASGDAHLPPGSYEFTVYGRSCDGNCGLLDPPNYVCTIPITVGANEQLTIEYDWTIPACGAT